jgi:hypothetical protein
MHDANDGSQVRPCSREPPRGNQRLGRDQGAHHDNMSTRGAPLGAASSAQFMRGLCRRQPGWPAGAGRNVAAKTWK